MTGARRMPEELPRHPPGRRFGHHGILSALWGARLMPLGALPVLLFWLVRNRSDGAAHDVPTAGMIRILACMGSSYRVAASPLAPRTGLAALRGERAFRVRLARISARGCVAVCRAIRGTFIATQKGMTPAKRTKKTARRSTKA